MPEKKTLARARQDLRAGKSPTTAAGEFVREEIDHIRAGKHGARSTKQAIAIGLAKARRAGVPLRPPTKGKTSARTRRSTTRDYEVGQHQRKPKAPSLERSRAALKALEHEPKAAASKAALARHARAAAPKARRKRA